VQLKGGGTNPTKKQAAAAAAAASQSVEFCDDDVILGVGPSKDDM
jgi:hypothetical protein